MVCSQFAKEYSNSKKTYICFPSRTAKIIKDYKIILNKNLGQNFLIDLNILKKIAQISSLSRNETILEIGSGIGTLTEILLENVRKVICVEIDDRLVRAFLDNFKEEVGNRIIIIKKDAMKLDFNEITEKYNINKVVSNLPYSIAAPLILKILVDAPQINKMYLMVQKDIAERLLAVKGDKNYSSFTIKANFLADFKILFHISRKSFVPIPLVDSTFVEVLRNKKSEGIDTNDFFNFVENCFIHRRKKLINSIIEGLDKVSEKGLAKSYIDKIDLIVKMLNGIGKDKNVRSEELTLQEFLIIFNSIKN